MKVLAVLLVTLASLAAGCSLAADVTPPPRTLTPQAKATKMPALELTDIASQILATDFYRAARAMMTATPLPRISSLQDIGRHVGRYPCEPLGEPGLLLKAPVLQGELRNVLGTEYEDFLGHLDHSTCVPIQRHGSYLLLHIFQPHVHADNTVIMIRETDGALFLLWLKNMLPEADLRLYSQQPIQNSELLEFARVMNITWGHVACFEPEGRTLRIDTGRYVNQDTGECLSAKSPN